MITGQVTEQEYVSAHRLHRRRMVAALNLAMIVAAALGIALAFTASRKWGMVLLFGGIGGLFGEFVQDRIFLPSKLRRLYVKARENGDVMLLYVNDALFEIVAKRWFGNAGDLDDFRRHLRFVK
jgi:hypothetical protein